MKSLLLFCSLEAALRLVVCSVPSLKDIYTSHCLSRWQNIVRYYAPVCMMFSLLLFVTLLWSGASHLVLTSVCVSSLDRNAFIYSPITRKIIFCGTFMFSPNSKLFTIHCNTGPLWSTRGPDAVQASYLVPSSSQTPPLVQRLLSIHSSLQHPPHSYVRGEADLQQKDVAKFQLIWRFRLALENWKGTLIVRRRGRGEMESDRLPSLTFYK